LNTANKPCLGRAAWARTGFAGMARALHLILALVSGVHAAPTTMMAVVATGSAPEGDWSKIKVVQNQPVPTPGPGQVLIQVAASSVNPVDWKIMNMSALDAATHFGRRPKVMGFDVAGTVVQLGAGCRRLSVGDLVWADLGENGLASPQLGAWAEFAVAEEAQVGLKPKNMDLMSAGSLPLVSLTDYQALRMTGAPWKDRANVTVVVTSGAGGTGTVALQLARAYGAARVVTAGSPRHFELLKRLGATDVIDYHKGTIWEALEEGSVDVVYDNFGAPGTADLAMASMRSDGVFIWLPGKGGAASRHPKPGVRQINYGLCDSSHHEDLDALAALAEAGQLVAVAPESYALGDIARALDSSVAGHVVGKLGINVTSLAQLVV